MLELLLTILAILAIAGVSTYFYVDSKKHKDSNVIDFDQVNKNLGVEKEDRLANLKYIVDQVNKTNKDMDTSYQTKFGAINKTTTEIDEKYKLFESGFGSIIRTKDNAGVEIAMNKLSTVPATDVELIKHISTLGGVTIKDLQNDATKPLMRLKACGTGANANRCIEIPNDNGDTYLTSLTEGKSIVAGAPLKTQDMSITGKLDMYTATNTPYMSFMGENTADGVISTIDGKATLKLVATKGVAAPSQLSLNKSDGKSAIIKINSGNELEITAPDNSTIRLNGRVLINNKLVTTEGNVIPPPTETSSTGSFFFSSPPTITPSPAPVSSAGTIVISTSPAPAPVITAPAPAPAPVITAPAPAPAITAPAPAPVITAPAPAGVSVTAAPVGAPTSSTILEAGNCSLLNNNEIYQCVDPTYTSLYTNTYLIDNGSRRQLSDAREANSVISGVLSDCRNLNSCLVGPALA